MEVVDTTPPDITCPAPLTLSRSDLSGTPLTDPEIQAWLASVTGSDLCGGVSLEDDAPPIFPTSCDGTNNTTTVVFTAIDERALSSSCSSTVTILSDQTDVDGDGFPCSVDCDETRTDVNPGALEVCDNVDNDCDGQLDEEPEASASCNDSDACTADSCDQSTGTCVNTDTSASCDDGLSCTIDSCSPSGGCSNAPTTDCPATKRYYSDLCEVPQPEDSLTQADAECVNDAVTFSGVGSVGDMCAILDPAQNNDTCLSAESEYMALMLNFCKGRVDDAQPIVSTCGTNQTAGQSRVQADVLLANPSRTRPECVLARCVSNEINTGVALGIGQ